MGWTDRAIDQLYIEIGHRIRAARTKRSRNQEELARDVNLTRSSIANIEAGRQKMSVHALMRIAEALDVAPISLLPDTDQVRDISGVRRVVPDLTGHSEDTRQFVTSALRRSKEGLHGSAETATDRADGR